MKKYIIKKVTKITSKPSRKEDEEAVKTLIKWAGDNPNREGLRETPKRVAKAYKEFFSGYESKPVEILSSTLTNCSSLPLGHSTSSCFLFLSFSKR